MITSCNFIPLLFSHFVLPTFFYIFLFTVRKWICETVTFNLVEMSCVGKTQHTNSGRFRSEFRTKSCIWSINFCILSPSSLYRNGWEETQNEIRFLLFLLSFFILIAVFTPLFLCSCHCLWYYHFPHTAH